jgi:sporulation protein YlmC with PRC-barrel domain
MKMTSKKLAPWTMMVLCLSFANGSSGADQVEATKDQGDKPGAHETPAVTAGAPARYDRASGIVGMTVRNQNDEHLGRIKDVVFDLKSERVAYAVMAANGTGVVRFKEKLLAVPLKAFTASADNRHLILRADKAKIEAAEGIDRDNWPSPTNPSWGADAFWQTDQEKPGSIIKPGYSKEQTPRPDAQPENK